ncbi:MAG: hybrid sensor histidine kinase/response regulator [Nitrospirae bacterium]|nr:hybrid sensor histidine kinase/response regulator [Nitrospirota bacterium]MBF0542201.1 hybrid sensor histidine kinase/response regulator [Nitrospirota bacterium]
MKNIIYIGGEMADNIEYAEEGQSQPDNSNGSWKLLVVDDEHEIHSVTRLALKDFTFLGKGLNIINAYNGSDAISLLEQNPDTALILLDVVMESDDSGLKVVKHIRDNIKNRMVRIIIRTGQPGVAPPKDVVLNYDIDDYKEKSELTSAKLFATIVSAIKSHETLVEQDRFNNQLKQMVAERTKELEAAKKAAEAASNNKTNFLNFVSHEMRTPLTSIIGFTALNKKKFDSIILPTISQPDKKVEKAISQLQSNLDITESEAERLLSLINNILDLAKIESGSVEWASDTVDMKDVFNSASAATSSLFNKKGLTLISSIDEGDFTLIGDKNRLIQVVINLFSNAIKFTDFGSITYSISKKDNKIRCEIKDTGSGIPENMLGKIFEQFAQVSGTSTDKPKGTGLGLPICKEIILHHKGQIWAESKIDAGSCFIFEI